jgi:alpha-galactosidase
MSRAPALARHERAGRLEPVRLAARYTSEPASQRSDGGPSWAEGPLTPGTQRLGPLEFALALDAADDAASLDAAVTNRGPTPLQLEALVLGFRWVGAGRELRFLRHGWQSWSDTGGRALDDAGEPAFPSGAWLRSMHHGVGAPPADRAGWHESALVSVAAGPAGACLAGLLERGLATGLVYLRRHGDDLQLEVEARLELPLEPGASLELERVRVALGDEPNRLLEDFADALGARAGARTGAAFQAGWCSWYQFFGNVSEADLLRTLDALAKARAEFPIDLVQLDDGYQRAVGDWLETNERFPRGLAPLAQEIRSAGFRAGIWLAPFCVVPESRLHAAHPDWLLRAPDGPFRGLLHPDWTREGSVYALDPSREEVRRHLLRLGAALAGMGFSYLKLDFLYVVAMQALAHDRRVSRAGRLARGLAAIREGAGEDTFLLGCGCPLGAAVGLVDGMRIGPDVAPSWAPNPSVRIPGLEPTLPSVANALRNVLARAWMHRRLWLNDPDCLMLRRSDTQLSAAEITSLAGSIAASGGMVVFSDDLSRLGPEETALLRETLALAREVDAGGARGTARARGLLDAPAPAGLVAKGANSAVAVLLNWEDSPRELEARLGDAIPAAGPLPPRALLGSPEVQSRGDGVVRASLAAHGSVLLRLPRRIGLAVFCDFDGTFAVQDVGSTIAKKHVGHRRPALWERLRRGELNAWQYNLELLDGLRLPEEELDAFLRTVELDPGAEALVRWCEAEDVPFRVLSDGFDRNLDRIQSLTGVRFAYDANRLWYEGGAWRIAASAPNPSCECGTGLCKRGRIEAFRALHPGACVVHVGNGRVSDLCGALAADVAFAKDTLAEELAARSVAYEPFTTLHDVVAGLARLAERLEI